MAFRNGQWVKFSAEIDGAHKAADGQIVGIFQRAGTDSLGGSNVDRIVVVDPKGFNLLTIKDGIAVPMAFPIETVKAEAVLSAADIPAERLKHNPDFEPRP